VGLIANANWMQMVDFALGWACIDIAGDDGRKYGLWPWQSNEATAPEKPPRAENKAAPEKRARRKKRDPEPVAAQPRPKTEFCLRCGGRRFVHRWPPVPAVESASRGLSAAGREWPGRWCDCWKKEATGD